MTEEEFDKIMDAHATWRGRMLKAGWRRVVVLEGPHEGLRWIQRSCKLDSCKCIVHCPSTNISGDGT